MGAIRVAGLLALLNNANVKVLDYVPSGSRHPRVEHPGTSCRRRSAGGAGWCSLGWTAEREMGSCIDDGAGPAIGHPARDYG